MATSTRARIAGILSLCLLLSSLGATGALAGAAPPTAAVNAAAATIGSNSCQGLDACDGLVGNVGDNSCNGEDACKDLFGNVGDNSCVAGGACNRAHANVGDNSCNAVAACNSLHSGVGDDSCNAGGACVDNGGVVGNHSCNGDNTCNTHSGVVGDDSCNANNACGVGHGDIGTGSCNALGACAHADAAVGDYSCNGASICFEAASAVGDCQFNTVTPPICEVQPDARIRRAGGSWRGNDIYNNDGTDQTITTAAAGGKFRRMYISIQNDEPVLSAAYTVHATGSAVDGITVRYFRRYSDYDITAAIEAGTFATPELAPGESYIIRIRIDIDTTAVVDSTVSRLVTASNEFNATQLDAVGFSVRRR